MTVSSGTRSNYKTDLQKGPTTEIGAPASILGNIPGIGAWSTWVQDDLEQVPELQFPNSIRAYHSMRNDSQVEGLYAGCTWPIRRYHWMIDSNGCDEARVKALARDLNLPIKGTDPAPVPRMKNRFVFDHHLKDALLAILYGFYPFEQMGSTRLYNDGLWHLTKLAPRPPQTVDGIEVAPDGGLVALSQNVATRTPGQMGPNRPIPVDRLVWYAWDKEGANWYGRSMLRAIYRNWLIKDRLLRVDAIKHERNGMGVPVGVGAPGMTDTELKKFGKLASTYKAGESAGGAIPYGTDLRLKGVEGSLPDTIGSIKFHNEEMARRFLMMFIQLGQTTSGSRALGQEFIDYFALAQETLANWSCDIFNEHVIEDWYDWNYSDNDDYVPKLTYEKSDDERYPVADLALMVQNDVVQVDDQLEAAIRDVMHLPEKDEKTVRVKATPTPPGDPGGVSNVPDKEQPAGGDTTPAKAETGVVRASAAFSPAAAAVTSGHPLDPSEWEGIS